MTSMKLYAFLDTNVLIHYRTYDEVDWPFLLGASAVCLVISQTVLDELDAFTHSTTSRRLRDRSRLLTRRFGPLIPTEDPTSEMAVPQRKGVTIRFASGSASVSLNDLGADTPDNRIIASLLAFRHTLPPADGDQVRLITADQGMQFRAVQNRIRVFAMPDEYRLKDEPTAEERELEKVKRELAEYEMREPRLSLAVSTENGYKTTVTAEIDIVADLSSAHLDRLVEEEARSVALAEPGQRMLPRGVPGISEATRQIYNRMEADRAAAMRVAGVSPTAEQVKRYSEGLPEYLRRYREYLQELNGVRQQLGCVVDLDLVLLNNGAAAAGNVILCMTLPDGVAYCFPGDYPEEPDPPARPRKPTGVLDGLQVLAADLSAGTISVPRLFSPRVDADDEGPIVTTNGRTDLEWRRSVAVPKYPRLLPPVTLVLPPQEGMYTCVLDYTIYAANVVEPAHGTIELHIAGTRKVI